MGLANCQPLFCGVCAQTARVPVGKLACMRVSPRARNGSRNPHLPTISSLVPMMMGPVSPCTSLPPPQAQLSIHAWLWHRKLSSLSLAADASRAVLRLSKTRRQMVAFWSLVWTLQTPGRASQSTLCRRLSTRGMLVDHLASPISYIGY